MAVLVFHSLALLLTCPSMILKLSEDRQTIFVKITRGKQIAKRYTLRNRMKGKKHPSITISLGTIITAFHSNCSSEMDKFVLLELLQVYFKSISYLGTQLKQNLFQVLLPYSTLPFFSSILYGNCQI